MVKFSGQQAPRAQFRLAYTTVETLLERNVAESRRAIREADQKTRAKKRNKSTEAAYK